MLKRTRRFTIYPCEDKFWKVIVVLAPTEKSLFRIMKNENCFCGDDTRALFAGYTVWHINKRSKRRKSTGELGTIYLNADDVDGEVVSHECGHAAFNYCKRLGKRDFFCGSGRGMVSHDQETYCYALGKMTDQVLGKLVNEYGFSFRK